MLQSHYQAQEQNNSGVQTKPGGQRGRQEVVTPILTATDKQLRHFCVDIIPDTKVELPDV